MHKSNHTTNDSEKKKKNNIRILIKKESIVKKIDI